ncbi:MAG TPA: TetR/AcrR family transcriptional regulator [Syntrophomonadaceae bacterium]|nr:TetR/AcrR family transcriptional regulator [Syntrophomonadaceae bacterium]
MNTDERIVKTFKEMARYKGFKALSLETLAAEAGVTRRTIYSYFSNKNDLIEKVVTAFLSDVDSQLEDLINKSDLIDSFAATAKSILKDGAFLFNLQSLKDLQVYYPKTWQQIEDFRINLINSLVEVIFKRTKKKWVLEMNPRILKEALLAIDRRFSTPEFASEIELPIEELTLEMAKLMIYPYL